MSGCHAQQKDHMSSEEQLRDEMVTRQIETRGVSGRNVLDAMLTVPRHLFVPEPYTSQAYDDTPLPIGEGQTISQPYIVAYMTEALELKPTDKILEIGTGSGYQAAILAEICDSVFTIEIFSSLADRAQRTLKELSYRNIFVKCGDGYQGWPEHAPFDAIIVTCAPEEVPETLKEQLAEGGRMIIPVGKTAYQYLVLMTKHNGKIRQHSLLPVRFVPMIDEQGRGY
jgi:protein-L-isoaspartate(D-aspartate) O-methyltransferase